MIVSTSSGAALSNENGAPTEIRAAVDYIVAPTLSRR